MKQPLEQPIRFVDRHKGAIVIIGVILFLLFSVGGAKLYLLARFLLGSDVVVSLNTLTPYVVAQQGSPTDISFRTSVAANPFCKPTCDSVFEDVSTGEVLQETSFNMQPGLPETKIFSVTPPSQGSGYVLYRITIACKTIPTALCHTAGQKTTRSAIVVVNYTLTQDAELKKETERKFIEDMLGNADSLFSLYESAQYIADEGTGKILNIQMVSNTSLVSFLNDLDSVKDQWEHELYDTVKSREQSITDNFYALNQSMQKTYNDLFVQAGQYNSVVQSLSDLSNELRNLSYQQPNKEFTTKIEGLIIRFNALNQSLGSPIDVSVSNDAASTLRIDVGSYEVQQADVFKILRTNVSETYNSLCNDVNVCNIFAEINSSDDCILISNSRKKLFEINQSFAENGTNQSKAQVESLLQSHVPSCTKTNFSVSVVSATQIGSIQGESAINKTVLKEPSPLCCVKGKCIPCCSENSCADPSYPVLLIHGHAFNRALSAEYSLEAFNKLQQKLEDDGFVSAGAVTLYTQHDIPYGTWGRFNVPFTIRVSYYFDLFKQPENYVVVQTNSENVDTYAIRLRDLIETTQYKTGKSKVDIITFSMGGLVVRRYVQLFGDSAIDKIIFIASPNHGVSGDVAQYCSFIGASLECRDLSKDSLLINKLTTGTRPSVNITNILGTGCQMKEGVGDGVVLESSAILEGANNIIINGTCRSTAFPLHTDLLDVDLYPEVYDAVRTALNITK